MLITHFTEDANQHFAVEQIQDAFINSINPLLADRDFCHVFVNDVKQAEETECCPLT